MSIVAVLNWLPINTLPLHRWNHLLEQISLQLKSGKDLLGLWQGYKSLHGQCAAAVRKQEDCADRLLKRASDREITEEENGAWVKDCDVSTSNDGRSDLSCQVFSRDFHLSNRFFVAGMPW